MTSVLYLIGKTLGKYQVLEHIGHGGMSEVYKAQHVELGRMVAVKVLHPFLANEEGFVIRFKREARIVATLRHPNIMQVYDFDYNSEWDIYYMVMEFIDGPTLKTRLAEGMLAQEEAVRIAALIADALDYAHRRGMVHRDVKPANIMFMPDGQPVLTDFGIAKMLTLSGLTASGAMVGTPAYMAPEVGLGRPGSALSDIYSLGVVLYQMLSGRLPFESDSPMGMVMQHINETPPPLGRFVPSLSPSLESVIAKALAKQPEARFANAGEMAAALRHIIGMEPLAGGSTVSPPPQSAALPTPSTPLTPSAAPLTPPSTPKVTSRPVEPSDEDEDDRLLRTWPALTEKDAPLRTPTLFPAAQPEESHAPSPRRATRPRLRWALTALIVMAVLAMAAWFGARGTIVPTVRQMLSLVAAMRQPPVASATPAIPSATSPSAEIEASPSPVVAYTATPRTISRTATPTASPTATPFAEVETAVPGICNPQIKLGQIRVEPSTPLSPGASFSAYISLRNNGNCAWPSGLRLAFLAGEQMAALNAIPLQAVAAGEYIQVIMSLHAPSAAGIYTTSWQVRQSSGQPFSSLIPIQVEVRVVGTPTPTPRGRATSTATPTPTPGWPPLVLTAPSPITWSEDIASGMWSATLQVQATGGVGNYRYYRQTIREDTLLSTGQLHIVGRRCQAVAVTLWVVSGKDAARWEGWIAYPAPEKCR